MKKWHGVCVWLIVAVVIFQQVEIFKIKYDFVSLSKVYKESTQHALKESDSVIINIPSKIYALKGREVNIYFENILNKDSENYDFCIDCDIGATFEEYYRVIPEQGGVYPLCVKVIKNGDIITEANTSIIVSEGNAKTNINCLIIGDSLVNTTHSTLVRSFYENFYDDSVDIKLVGRKGKSPYLHEGNSGWSAESYIQGDESPFRIENKVDFSQYANKYCDGKIDVAFVILGINDVFGIKEDKELNEKVDLVINDYSELISIIHQYDKNIKVAVCLTIPPSKTQDGFGDFFGNEYYRWRYKINNATLVDRMIDCFDNMERDNVFIVPININIDTENSFGQQEVALNAHKNEKKIIPAYGGHVHPALDGYCQIADEMYFFVKCITDKE